MQFHQDLSFNSQVIRLIGHSVYKGSDIGECLSTINQISTLDYEEWHRKWFSLAEKVFFEGKNAESSKDKISAYESFLRASNYYRYSIIYMDLQDPRLIKIWEKSVRAFQKALSHSQIEYEILEIPYGETTLFGYLFLTDPKAPLLIANGGKDHFCEELFFFSALPAITRGYNAFIFEGPGQGGLFLQYRFVFRYNFEGVIGSIIDELASLERLHSDQIALYGLGFSSILCSRAAAFEKRVKALIVDPPLFDVQSFFAKFSQQNIEFLSDNVRNLEKEIKRFGQETIEGFVQELKHYTLENISENIKCPTLVLENDAMPLFKEEALAFYDSLQCMKQSHLFRSEEGAGGPCQPLAHLMTHKIIFSWLNSIFY